MFNSIKPDQNPQTSLIQQCLANYDYFNATALAEDLLLQHESEENKGLLADCYLYQQENIKAYLLLKTCTSTMNLYKLAVACLRLGKLTEAENALLKGKEVPNGVHGIELLGTIYKKQGKDKEARETYRKALQKNPNLLATKKKLDKLTIGFERFEVKNEVIQEEIPNLFGKLTVPVQNTTEGTGLFERKFVPDESLFGSNQSQKGQNNDLPKTNEETKRADVEILAENFRKKVMQAEQEKKQNEGLPVFGTGNMANWMSTKLPSDEEKSFEVVDFASEGNEKKSPSQILVVEKDSSIIRKGVKKGKSARAVDMYFDEEDCKVYTGDDGKFYSKIMNFQNIAMNGVKFYIAQLLESTKNRGTFFFWTRWGRVGVRGQCQKIKPANLEEAIKLFDKKVYEKTVKGDYQEIEMDYGEDEKETNQSAEKESKLPEPVQDLMKLIFDVKMMTDFLKESGYDARKLPAGKISWINIKMGYEILKELSDAIERQRSRDILMQYSVDFYTIIPHDFGFHKISNFVIDTAMKVKQKLELLASIENIRIAFSILSNPNNEMHLLDYYHQKLNCAFSRSLPESEDFAMISEYLQNTYVSTHSAFTLEVLEVFSLERQGEAENYLGGLGNKQLLWFGTRLNNYAGILAQGFKLPPAEAPESGYMFGKGVYFADMASKAANYCFVSPGENVGILMLCEVALGECDEKFEPDFGAAGNLPNDKHSVKGVGRSEPAASGSKIIGDEVTVPMGKPENKNIGGKVCLLYNEYVVYDVNQIKMRYLVKVKFNSKFN